MSDELRDLRDANRDLIDESIAVCDALGIDRSMDYDLVAVAEQIRQELGNLRVEVACLRYIAQRYSNRDERVASALGDMTPGRNPLGDDIEVAKTLFDGITATVYAMRCEHLDPLLMAEVEAWIAAHSPRWLARGWQVTGGAVAPGLTLTTGSNCTWQAGYDYALGRWKVRVQDTPRHYEHPTLAAAISIAANDETEAMRSRAETCINAAKLLEGL